MTDEKQREALLARVRHGSRRHRDDALVELIANHWLYKADLSHTDLRDADLRNAWFGKVNANHADLRGAKLDGINVASATFRHARLDGLILPRHQLANVDLSYASLRDADLSRGEIWVVDLVGANLVGADLHESNWLEIDLRGADLTNANLENLFNHFDAICNEHTILPDGTHWSPDTDVDRFINPKHPNFWRPSPPYPKWYNPTDSTAPESKS